MKLLWSDESLSDLEGIAERAPRAAVHVYEAIRWLARQPFPHAFRRIEGRPGEHVLSVAPYVVFYAVDDNTIVVLTIEDSRRRREGW